MLSRTLVLRLAAGMLAVGVLVPAQAQDAEPPKASFSSMINVDALIDNYARLLARKYDLTEEQDAFTQEFMREKAHAFLDQHRDKLFELVDKMFDVRGGGEFTQQELVDWGKRALPLFEQAKVIIIDGNNQWREILTEDQRRIHDADVKMMFDSFSSTQEKLNRIVTGTMTVEEFRRGEPGGRRREPGVKPTPPAVAMGPGVQAPSNPTPAQSTPAGTTAKPTPTGQPGKAQTATVERTPSGSQDEAMAKLRQMRNKGDASPPPANPRGGQGRSHAAGRTEPAQGSTDFESQWEAYVREFIQRYQLNDEQAQRAQSILKDCQEQGNSYMAKRKADLEELDKKVQTLTEANKAKELGELNQRRAKLLEPIGRIFEQQLKPRLEKLPTPAQKQAAEKAGRPPAGPPGGPPGGPGKPAPTPRPVRPVPQPQPQPQPIPPPGDQGTGTQPGAETDKQ